MDLLPTGNTFQTYIDPERDVPDNVVETTGLTREFLTGKPRFSEKSREFLDFIGDSQLVAHNAEFDRNFINAELERAGYNPIDNIRFIDTLEIARSKFPGASNSLDALCRRFNISLSGRVQHGALIDAQLLANVYLELKGGRARRLELGMPLDIAKSAAPEKKSATQTRSRFLKSLITEQELEAHQRFVADQGGEKQTMIWQDHWKKMKYPA